MNKPVEILDNDIEVGQAVAPVVEKAGQMMTRHESAGAVTPMDMIDRALASNASPDTLERLLALQERWEASQARKAFDEAMAAAKAEIPTIRKNRVVDFTSQKGRTHYKHEDLAEVARTVNPILSKFGLSYRFRTSSAIGEPISVTCVVSHRLGYSEENTLVGPRDDSGNKNSLQQVGSTLTYLQRMTLKAALGLAAAEDDDGKAGGVAENDGPISEAQAATVRQLIKATDTDEAAFLNWLDVASVEDIARSQMRRVEESFAAKKRRMAS